MKRTEIDSKIILSIQSANTGISGNAILEIAEKLTDLFIELSNERCIDQRMICHDEILKIDESLCEIMDPVLNAPLPEIN